jgi:preprotein translocase SecE subunit
MERTSTMAEQLPGPTAKPASKVPLPTSKRGLNGFFKDLQREARQVSWPTPQEATRLTGTVLGVCVIVATLLWLLSTGVRLIFSAIGVQ